MKTGLSGSFGRLSSRERTLVGGLLAMVLLLVVGGGFLYVNKKLKTKEAEIAKNRADWAKVQKLGAEYVHQRRVQDELMERIKTNPDASAPDSPVAQASVRAKVHVRTPSNAEDETGMMNQYLLPKGQQSEKALLTKKRKTKGPQIFRVEKDFQMEGVYARLEDVFSYLETVESLKTLVLVTKLKLKRMPQDPDYAQIETLTASTLKYVEKEE